jgi:L-alanine-DL-glutamate epimerase-like enolase superfamily enzyme
VAEQLGLPWPPPLVTAHTVSLDEPQRMGREATQLRAHPLLKLKLGQGPDDLARLEAVRAAAPASSLVVDVNEGWSPDQLEHLLPRLAELGVALVEQPLPAGADEALAEMDHLVPIAADESCHDRHSLAELADRYEVVNIKLDKTGGLTEALALKEQVLQAGLQVMVGCMVSTSLSIVPAMLVAHQAPWVDLDGPAWLAQDRSGGCTYGSGGRILPPEAGFWGKHR